VIAQARPGDHVKPSDIEVVYYFNSKTGPVPTALVSETVTITAPLDVGQSVAAKIAGAPSATGAEIAQDIDDAEAKLRAAVPSAKYVFLEPDIDRGAN
jgi:hypothetical protein